MTILAQPATCAAQFPALTGSPRPLCDRLPHDDRMHVACVGGVPFAWSDPDDTALHDWDRATIAAVRDVYGDTPPPQDRLTSLVDAVEVLVAYWRALPGGTDRFDRRTRALIAAYDQLDGVPGAGVPA